MSRLVVIQAHHSIPQDLFITLDFFCLFFLIFAIYLVPLQWVLGAVVLCAPVGDVPGDESLPELGIFSTDMRIIDFYFMELLWRFNALKNCSNLPVLE